MTPPLLPRIVHRPDTIVKVWRRLVPTLPGETGLVEVSPGMGTYVTERK